MFSKSGLRIVVGHYGYKSSFGANNQRCCVVATDVNFPRKLTGLTSLVANLNQKVVLIGGIVGGNRDSVQEVLRGILQSVLMTVCWFAGAAVRGKVEDLAQGGNAESVVSKRPRRRCSQRATCLCFAW